MKKAIALTVAMGLYLKFGVKKVYAWSGKTHEDIVKKALALLEKEKKLRPSFFYKNWHKEILIGCTQPDEPRDTDKGTGMHYYSCVNPKGKELKEENGYYKNRCGKLLRSARTLLEENYTAAVSLYKSGNVEYAMTIIGRAAHFISDMGCTVHTSNIRYLPNRSNIHCAFESHVNTTCVKYTAERFDKRLSKYYEKDTFEEAVHKLIKYSAKFTNVVSLLDPRAFDDTAKNTLPVTQQNVMALFIKFYDDCTQDKGNYIEDNKSYTLKNEATDMVITTSEKGLILQKQDKSKEQKLIVNLTPEGTFSLKTYDGSFVSKNLKGYDYLKMNGKPAQFKIAALGKRKFRITTEASNYEKVLGITKSGKIASVEFEPENKSQIWILN